MIGPSRELKFVVTNNGFTHGLGCEVPIVEKILESTARRKNQRLTEKERHTYRINFRLPEISQLSAWKLSIKLNT